MIVEALIASVSYCIYSKWGSALYWFSAALLNIAVVYVIKKVG
jgi:hypothetical protein